jgi:hypothetical protein
LGVVKSEPIIPAASQIIILINNLIISFIYASNKI